MDEKENLQHDVRFFLGARNQKGSVVEEPRLQLLFEGVKSCFVFVVEECDAVDIFFNPLWLLLSCEASRASRAYCRM